MNFLFVPNEIITKCTCLCFEHAAVPDDIYSARKDLDDEDMLVVLEKCYNVIHGRKSSHATSATSTTTEDSQIGRHSAEILSRHMKRHIFDAVRLGLTRLDHNLYDIIWPTVKKLPTDSSFRYALEQDFPLGIVAPDFYVYKVFREFLEPIIKNYNNMDQHAELVEHPDAKFIEILEGESDEKNDFVEIKFEFDNKPIISG
ncbi:hypothetical protein HHI36_007465 [Cryptolaemus montrouzieri]|uniref:Phosphagen kinase N-terminal domain-containing protein n=1 Tax=Cryptolaemus montrouzieri TaxID=559131 RepID=A0ABD2MPP9_9CUCU